MAKSSNKQTLSVVNENTPGTEKNPVYIVDKEFRDRNDFTKVYSEGDDVSHFEESRLEHLIKHGIVKKIFE
jgi:hypothetical protein